MESKEIKVSVVIPIYNVEVYIEECLSSVIHQTLSELEVICVNDGTPDHSMEIVQRMSEQDKRIRIVNKENGGLSTARNVGLYYAKGEFVYFLDSDDYIMPDTLKYLYRVAREENLDNIYFGAQTIYESQEIKKKYYRRFENYYHRVHQYDEVMQGTRLLQELMSNGEYRTSACLQMMRRTLLQENNIQFYEGILHEDNLFSLQCILCAKRARVVDKDFYIRRVRNESIMTTDGNLRSSWGYYICIKQMWEFLQDKQYDSATWKCVGDVLSVMQSDAVYQIKGMNLEELERKLPNAASMQDKIQYMMLVKNVEQIKKQDNLWYKVFKRIIK